uniref:Uncharacterized protein n=1 Tax=Arundo donax TaxID=35708 RepID=A0A0A9HMG8_ARUDO
MFSFSKSVESK